MTFTNVEEQLSDCNSVDLYPAKKVESKMSLVSNKYVYSQYVKGKN